MNACPSSRPVPRTGTLDRPRVRAWAYSRRSPCASARSRGCPSCSRRSSGWTRRCRGHQGPGLGAQHRRPAELSLTVPGRRSGIPRTTPLLRFPHHRGCLIASSYFGGPKTRSGSPTCGRPSAPGSALRAARSRSPGADLDGPARAAACDEARGVAGRRERRRAHRPGDPGLPAHASLRRFRTRPRYPVPVVAPADVLITNSTGAGIPWPAPSARRVRRRPTAKR